MTIDENFIDGRNPEDKGDMARHGLKGKTIAQLKKVRASSTASARQKQLAHWYINMHKEEKQVWDKENPVKNHDELTPAQKAKAKARAQAAGRPYPNMVDNIWAARNENEEKLNTYIQSTNLSEPSGPTMNEAKATMCGRCGTKHVPPSQGGKCPALKEDKVTKHSIIKLVENMRTEREVRDMKRKAHEARMAAAKPISFKDMSKGNIK